MAALGDNSKTLKERLEMLKPMLTDSALLSKFFGVENANAARALIQGTDALEEFTEAVTGTSSATDQAAIIMQSYAERQAVVNAKIEDFKISIFQATGDLTIWAGAIMGVLTPLAQIMPLIMGVGKLMLWVKGLNWAGMWGTLVRRIGSAYRQLAIFNVMLTASNSKILQSIGHLGVASLALIRFATVGIFNAVKGLGALVLSLVTGGTASATFSGVASTAFGTFATTAAAACRAVGLAIMNIPIIGWVAAGIAALVAIGTYFWNTSAKFRAVLKGTWAEFKACFSGIGELAKTTFGAIGDLIKAAFSLDASGISAALAKLKAGFSDYGKQVGRAFNEAYDAEMSDSARKDAAEKKNSKPTGKTSPSVSLPTVTPTVDPTGGTLSTAGSGSGSGDTGGKIKNITINIEKLVESFNIHTASMGESMEQMKAAVLDTLMGALNDTQLAIG